MIRSNNNFFKLSLKVFIDDEESYINFFLDVTEIQGWYMNSGFDEETYITLIVGGKEFHVKPQKHIKKYLKENCCGI